MTASVCVVEGCGKRVVARKLCNTHYRRWQRHGDPQASVPIERKLTGGVSYWSVRERLRTACGPASSHRCALCSAVASDWAYCGGDPDERVGPGPGGRYSLDLDRYQPQCRPCLRRTTLARTQPAERRNTPVDVQRAAWLYERGVNGRGIAALLGVSRNAVYRELRAHGVPIRPPGNKARPTLQAQQSAELQAQQQTQHQDQQPDEDRNQ